MKGMTALEIVFLLFIMIIVTLVIIRLVQTYVTITPIVKPIENWQDTYNYDSEKAKCRNICDRYISGSFGGHSCDQTEAIRFCKEKVALDINGNRQPGEKNVGNLVMGIPYCEDGLYCFHILPDCSCGGQTLTAQECLRILCNYYNSTSIGYTKEEATAVIQNLINPGTCHYVDEVTGKNESYWYIHAGYLQGCV